MSKDLEELARREAGFVEPPSRYTKQERETIDRMRDFAHKMAASVCCGDDVDWLADLLFIFHCEATALKYEDRNGSKGDPLGDQAKAEWYVQMAEHVRSPETKQDPRASREGFVPYERPKR